MTILNVTATVSGASVPSGIGLKVNALVNAHATQNGNHVASFPTNDAGTHVWSLPITPTFSNSLVFLTGAAKFPKGVVWTAGNGFTMLADMVGPGDWDMVSGYVSGPTTASVAVTANVQGNASGAIQGMLAEVKAAAGQTLTIASQSPSGVIAANAANTSVITVCTLPVGTYTLMAQVVTESGGSPLATITMSDDNSLTWTKVFDSAPQFNSGFNAQTQIWMAPFTSTPPPATVGEGSVSGELTSIGRVSGQPSGGKAVVSGRDTSDGSGSSWPS
jgi:hypothetical protein